MHPVPFYNWFCKFMNKFVSFSVSAWHSEPCFDFVRRKSGMRHSLNLTEPVSLIHNRWMSRVRPTNLPIRTMGVCAASTGFTISWLIFKCERGNSDESFPCNHQEKPPEYSLLWYFIKVKGLFSDLVSRLAWVQDTSLPGLSLGSSSWGPSPLPPTLSPWPSRVTLQ